MAGRPGLSEAGVAATLRLPQVLPTSVERGVAVIRLFSGIDALRRALDILGLQPIRHIAIDIDKAAARNTKELYPDMIHFRDFTVGSIDDLHQALFVLAMGGAPCQGLSRVNATRRGFEDPRINLLFHMLRVFTAILKEKHRLHYCSGNSASVSEADKAEFISYLRVMPLRIGSRGLCRSRRTRFVLGHLESFSGPRSRD